MNRHRYRARDYMEHMVEASERITSYISGLTLDAFLTDTMTQDAVVRNLEVLGEASMQLFSIAPQVATRFPDIPFRTMYATRNRMIHGYVTVNFGIVYEVATEEMPRVLKVLKAALTDWPADLS